MVVVSLKAHIGQRLAMFHRFMSKTYVFKVSFITDFSTAEEEPNGSGILPKKGCLRHWGGWGDMNNFLLASASFIRLIKVVAGKGQHRNEVQDRLQEF